MFIVENSKRTYAGKVGVITKAKYQEMIRKIEVIDKTEFDTDQARSKAKRKVFKEYGFQLFNIMGSDKFKGPTGQKLKSCEIEVFEINDKATSKFFADGTYVIIGHYNLITKDPITKLPVKTGTDRYVYALRLEG